MRVLILLSSLVYSWQSLAADSIPNYPCYRTVEATYAAAEKIVRDHPELATWTDIGDSWEKKVGEGGYDLMVLKLTNRDITGPKPTLFMSSAIHAREYATAELATRFVEHLVSQYGKDADVTWMLDYHEAHFLLVFNPDGRKQAEPNVMWRKNTNRAYCGSNSRDRGVDMNRNFDYQWGRIGSSRQCSETYKGPSPASEPEVQAVQSYIRSLFPEARQRQRAAPADTPGMYIDVHSYGEVIYQPSLTPNHRAITTLNRKFSFFNGYRPALGAKDFAPAKNTDHPIQAYESHEKNTTFNFGYGDRGIASYLFELGTAFFQKCDYFESSIQPGNIDAFTYALKVLRKPYVMPAGPEAVDLRLTKRPGKGAVLMVKLDDTRYGSGGDREATHDIDKAEFYVDTPPWVAGAIAQPMAPVGAQFDDPVEEATATIEIDKLEAGRHIVFVRGRDQSKTWGPVSAIFLDVD